MRIIVRITRPSDGSYLSTDEVAFSAEYPVSLDKVQAHCPKDALRATLSAILWMDENHFKEAIVNRTPSSDLSTLEEATFFVDHTIGRGNVRLSYIHPREERVLLLLLSNLQTTLDLTVKPI
jgi:hypothetical protein